MELFAANLRKRAEELGLSHAEVARRAGLSERRYGNYVSGRREPDLATLVKIATVLATTANDLLARDLIQTNATELARGRIVSALNTLKKADLDRLAIMIDALSKASTSSTLD